MSCRCFHFNHNLAPLWDEAKFSKVLVMILLSRHGSFVVLRDYRCLRPIEVVFALITTTRGLAFVRPSAPIDANHSCIKQARLHIHTGISGIINPYHTNREHHEDIS